MQSWRADIGEALRLFTRLPVPGEVDIATSPRPSVWRALPIVGAIVGMIEATVLIIAYAAMGDPLTTACLALIVGVLATGCFHEDGLADTADGFGGGWSRERKLEIMRDSRLGAYGVTALILSLMLRAALMAPILTRLGPLGAGASLIGLEAAARAAAVWFAHRLPPARHDGASHAAGQPSAGALRQAIGLALIALLPTIGLLVSLWAFVLVVAGMVVASQAMVALSRRQIDGQTGDVAGACQQITLIAGLVSLAIATHLQPL